MPGVERILATKRRLKDGKDWIELVAGKGWRIVFEGQVQRTSFEGRVRDSFWKLQKDAAIELWKLQKKRKEKPEPLSRLERLMSDDDPLSILLDL